MASRLPPAVIAIALVVVVLLGVLAVVGRRGGGLSARVVARCRDGHLFMTIWIPLASFKAIRLGPVRYQFCPVGRHWTFVTIVPDADLTPEERWLAEQSDDGPLP